MRARIHAYIYAIMLRMHVCMYVCMYACMYVRTYVRTYVHVYSCVCPCTFICMYVCMYTCIAYTHTHTHLICTHPYPHTHFLFLNTLAHRSDWAFLAELYSVAIEAGATTLNVPDTVRHVLCVCGRVCACVRTWMCICKYVVTYVFKCVCCISTSMYTFNPPPPALPRHITQTPTRVRVYTHAHRWASRRRRSSEN